MPSYDIFRPRTDDEIKSAMRRAKAHAHARTSEEYNRAIDYLENRQFRDTEDLLRERYPSTQEGDRGQRIEALTVPLVQRYVDEIATAYARPVKRKILNEDGSVNDEATKIVNDELAFSRFDEIMASIERRLVLMGSCGLWFQVRRGRLRPVVVLPQDIHPLAPEKGEWMDPSDQDDYFGFIVCASWHADDLSRTDPKMHAMLTRTETAYYVGQDPFEPQGTMQKYPNPYAWPQMIDTEDQRGAMNASAPLQMFSIWKSSLTPGHLIAKTDVDIVTANRELNVQWSLLLDTIRIQGWDTPVINRVNEKAANPRTKYGARFPVDLLVGETFTRVGSSTPYVQIVDTLKSLLKTIAVAHSMSPNDLNADASSPQSGFAKLVDSLPKIDARQKAVTALRYQEEQLAWPRIASALMYLGKLGAGAEKLKMSVEFADVEFPSTVDEEARKNDADIKLGLTTPAKILAKRTGMTPEQAEEEIAANVGSVKEMAKLAAPEQSGSIAGDPSDPSVASIDPDSEISDKIQSLALNGAQVSSMIELVSSVATGLMPRESALEIITIAFQVDRSVADKIIGEAGRGFVPSESGAGNGKQAKPNTNEEKSEPGAGSMLGRLIGRSKSTKQSANSKARNE